MEDSSPSSQLLEAEQDERALRKHVHRIHDQRALEMLRRVRARIAGWQERLRSGVSQ